MGKNDKILIIGLLCLEFAFNPCCLQKTGPDNSRKIPEDHFLKKEKVPYRPFQFKYETKDKNGSTIYHFAQGDTTGKISGTYGYILANGLYRKVAYVANSTGYYPIVQTNEPGIGKENPADVILDVMPVPEAVARRIATQTGSQKGYDVQKRFTESAKGVTPGVVWNPTRSPAVPYGGYGMPVGPEW